MSNAPIFFKPVDPIAINTLLSLSPAQWHLQSAAPSTTKDRASGLGSNGDEIAWQGYNAMTQMTVVYKCFDTSETLALPSVGTVTNSWHIDSVALAYSPTDWPTLTVTLHKHGDTTHTAESCNTYKTLLQFPAQFGIPSAIVDDSTTIFELTNTAIGLRSLAFTLTCTHVDENGSTGNWLCGENHDGVATLDVEFTGQPADGEVTIDSSWHKSSDGSSSENTAVDGRSLSLVRHVLRVVPVDP